MADLTDQEVWNQTGKQQATPKKTNTLLEMIQDLEKRVGALENALTAAQLPDEPGVGTKAYKETV